MVIADNMIVN